MKVLIILKKLLRRYHKQDKLQKKTNKIVQIMCINEHLRKKLLYVFLLYKVNF